MRRAIGVSGGLVLGTRGCSNVVGIIRRVCDEMIASGGRAEANSAGVVGKTGMCGGGVV